jgi:hypothetical protein
MSYMSCVSFCVLVVFFSSDSWSVQLKVTGKCERLWTGPSGVPAADCPVINLQVSFSYVFAGVGNLKVCVSVLVVGNDI